MDHCFARLRLFVPTQTSGAMPELNSFAASLVAPHPTPSEQVPSSTTLETQEPVPSLVAQLQQVNNYSLFDSLLIIFRSMV